MNWLSQSRSASLAWGVLVLHPLDVLLEDEPDLAVLRQVDEAGDPQSLLVSQQLYREETILYCIASRSIRMAASASPSSART